VPSLSATSPSSRWARVVAFEPSATYRADRPDDAQVAAARRHELQVAVARPQAAAVPADGVVPVERLIERPVGDLDDDAIRAELAAVEQLRRRLHARSCRLAAALTERQQRRALEARPVDAHAVRHATRRTQQELQERLRWTPSEAKRAQRLGKELTHTPAASRAFDRGQLPPTHAKLLADTRGVVARDGARCIGDGCDVPTAWCDVMHLDVPYALGGRLTIDTAGLGCGFHHHRLDRGGWTVSWVDGRPVVHPPDRPPRRPPGTHVSARPPDRSDEAGGTDPPDPPVER
jgi:hypothetical protein